MVRSLSSLAPWAIFAGLAANNEMAGQVPKFYEISFCWRDQRQGADWEPAESAIASQPNPKSYGARAQLRIHTAEVSHHQEELLDSLQLATRELTKETSSNEDIPLYHMDIPVFPSTISRASSTNNLVPVEQ